MWKNISKLLGYFENVFTSLLLISTTLVLFLNIIQRYFLGRGFSWAEEYISYAMIWVTFLGISICVRQKAHVAMTLLIDSIKLITVKKIYQAVLSIVSILFCGWFLYLGIKQVIFLKEMGQTSPAMRLPMYVPYLAIPIGFGLMVVRLMEQFIEQLKYKMEQ